MVKVFIISVVSLLFFISCSSQQQGVSEKEYQRANAASQQAHDRLDRE